MRSRESRRSYLPMRWIERLPPALQSEYLPRFLRYFLQCRDEAICQCAGSSVYRLPCSRSTYPAFCGIFCNAGMKLFANALDRASTACLAVGVLTPLSAVFFAMPGYSTTPIWIIEFGVGAWMLCTLALHSMAMR